MIEFEIHNKCSWTEGEAASTITALAFPSIFLLFVEKRFAKSMYWGYTTYSDINLVVSWLNSFSYNRER